MQNNFSKKIYNNIPAKSHIILAVSGGLDSTVLMHLCKEITSQYTISVAHINHNFHKDSKKMENFVQNLAKDNNWDFYTKSINANQIDSNIESKLRDKRYKLLDNIKNEINADYIFTAHHSLDQAETIFMKILNSSGFNGLKGIREKKKHIFRPMLNFIKKDIIDYANQHNLKYLDDPTNNDEKFLRNFLRKNIFSKLHSIKPNIEKPFTSLKNRINEVNELIEYNTDNFFESDNYSHEGDLHFLQLDNFNNYPFLLKLNIIKRLCISNNQSFNKNMVEELKDFLKKGKTGTKKNLNNYVITFDRKEIVISNKQFSSFSENVIVDEEKLIENFTFKWSYEKMPKKFSKDRNTEYIDADKISSNLTIRSIKSDDYFYPLGMNGKKKVSKFLNDKKISYVDKKNTFVVCNGAEIVWVAGHQLSNNYRLSKNSKKIAKLNFYRN